MHAFPLFLPGRIVHHQEALPGHYLLRMQLASGFPEPQPGQFIMIRSREAQGPLLARPMSIYAFDRALDSAFVEIFYRLAGEGTRLLSELKPDQETLILGPLGKGFTVDLDDACGRVILVAGGMGISPLTFLAARLKDLSRERPLAVTAYVGARRADLLAGLEQLSSYCPDVRVCTDDGSAGHPGTVVDRFSRELAEFDGAASRIYTCGPPAMMKGLSEMLERHSLFCEASVEERMACGLGACLGCAVAVRTAAGRVDYRRACKDGPVFNIRELVWS